MYLSKFFLVFSDKLFVLNSARRQILKEGFSRNKADVFTGSFNYCQSECEATSIFAPRYF